MPTGAADGPTPLILTIDHVQLAMPAGGGEDEARRFYVDVLGLGLEEPLSVGGG